MFKISPAQTRLFKALDLIIISSVKKKKKNLIHMCNISVVMNDSKTGRL